MKSGLQKIQMEEMAYIRNKNDINRHIRYDMTLLDFNF